MSGSGPPPCSTDTRGFTRTRTASTPPPSSERATGCCGEDRGLPARAWPRRRSGTGTIRSVGRSSLAFDWRGIREPSSRRPPPTMSTLAASKRIRIHSRLSDGGERRLADDVLDGLTRPFKELPPKHFYDSRGSELFERICDLPEYYPTRTERQILVERAQEIVERTRATELVELGSGSAEKARILLDAMARAGTLRRYVPLDVSEQALLQAAGG